jgi:glycosyltransferase involved in cell wall biosynthesis
LADLVVTTAERDSNFIQRDFPGTKIVLGPNGADTEYFSPMLHIEPEKSSLVFFGALQVQMNEDGVLFFLDEIFPLIKLKVEDAQLKIVGKNPSRALTMRHSPPSIDVLGEVPDVRVPVAQSSVVVVPNLYGGGTKLKTIEAMSMGKAVVSTSTGVQGLGVRDGIEVLIADDPIEFAGKTTRALLDKDLAFQLGLNARQFVKDNFDWRSISAGIIKELEIRIPDNPANGG